MQPYISGGPLQPPDATISEEEGQAREVDLTSNGGSWGAFVVLAIIVAAIVLGVWFLSASGGGEVPPEPAPGEQPADPGY